MKKINKYLFGTSVWITHDNATLVWSWPNHWFCRIWYNEYTYSQDEGRNKFEAYRNAIKSNRL